MVEYEGEGQQPIDRVELMLQVYALERQHQQSIMQLITTMVTILFTYVVATVGFAVHQCGTALHAGRGCHGVPAGIGLVTPAPTVGLLAFFTIMRLLFAASVGYTRGLEHDIAREMQRRGTEPFPMPRSLVGERRSRVKHLPGLAFGLTYLLCAGYIVLAEVFLVPWKTVGHSVAPAILGTLFIGATAACGLARRYVFRKHIEPMVTGLGASPIVADP